MSKKYKKRKQDNAFLESSGETTLPVTKPVAVYYRQSTLAQVGNHSTLLQTVDMVEHLVQKGWKRSDVILIDMDEGISGTKKIDEREGMSLLYKLIVEKQIGAVACEDEDRLFRDITQIEVNIFIEACRSNRVLVMTPTMVYDFAHPMMGDFFIKQFRFKSEVAAEYIKTFVKGKLYRAKRRLLLEGRWAGSRLPPGYMVDVRKALPNGQRNENWRRFVPFEPYAEIVREYFRIFLSYNGCFNSAVRHIHYRGPYYPDPNVCKPPKGYRVVYPMHRYEYGYCAGYEALKLMLTNAVYIGHWVWDDAILVYDNHAPVIDKETFTKAFNYLSPVSFDGSPNLDYRPFRQNRRPTKEIDRLEDRPLCEGMIGSYEDQEWRNAGVTYLSHKGKYRYVLYARLSFEKYVWSRTAHYIDDAVHELLLAKLSATFDEDMWHKVVSSFSEEVLSRQRVLESRLSHLQKVMDNLLGSLDTLTSPVMIKRVQERYEKAQSEEERLLGELEEAHDEARMMAAVSEIRENFHPAIENWNNMDRDEKRTILRTFVDHVEIKCNEKSTQVVVHWLDSTNDVVTLARRSDDQNLVFWLKEDIQMLLELINRHATQIEIAKAFPDRTWEGIRRKSTEITGRVLQAIEPKPIRDTETYSTYLKRVAKPKRLADSSNKWTKAEVTKLLEMFNSDSTQIEISRAFPYRKWVNIRKKFTTLCGKVKIKDTGNIKRNETYGDYCHRMGIDDETTGRNQISAPVGVEQVSDEDIVTERGTKYQSDYPTGTRVRAL